MTHRTGITRSYDLTLCANAGKAEAARYAVWWQTHFCLDYLHRLFWLPDGAQFSTARLGKLNNDSQRRARQIVASGRAAERASDRPFGCPQSVPVCADAELSRARRSVRFPIWVKVPRGPHIPAQAHRAFSAAIRRGAILRPRCEIRLGKRGGLVARVFVEYPRKDRTWTRDVIGADAGINSGVATSDGRKSVSLWPTLRRSRDKRAAQNRQHHHRSSTRTAVKQILDREARRLVTLASRGGKTIAVERLKTLANLKPTGRAGGWARVHFGTRIRQIAEEVGVPVIEVNAAYTSQTCPVCDHVSPTNRRGPRFQCGCCGFRDNADLVAARNIARKARRVVQTRDEKATLKLIAQPGLSPGREALERGEVKDG